MTQNCIDRVIMDDSAAACLTNNLRSTGTSNGVPAALAKGKTEAPCLSRQMAGILVELVVI